jgi:hypothetical protein
MGIVMGRAEYYLVGDAMNNSGMKNALYSSTHLSLITP